MLEHTLVELVGEVVDGIAIELNISLFVDSLETKLVEVARPTELLVFEHVPHFIITEDCILRDALVLNEDLGFKFVFFFEFFIFKFLVP